MPLHRRVKINRTLTVVFGKNIFSLPWMWTWKSFPCISFGAGGALDKNPILGFSVKCSKTVKTEHNYRNPKAEELTLQREYMFSLPSLGTFKFPQRVSLCSVAPSEMAVLHAADFEGTWQEALSGMVPIQGHLHRTPEQAGSSHITQKHSQVVLMCAWREILSTQCSPGKPKGQIQRRDVKKGLDNRDAWRLLLRSGHSVWNINLKKLCTVWLLK